MRIGLFDTARQPTTAGYSGTVLGQGTIKSMKGFILRVIE
jgi:hypothetical protein